MQRIIELYGGNFEKVEKMESQMPLLNSSLPQAMRWHLIYSMPIFSFLREIY